MKKTHIIYLSIILIFLTLGASQLSGTNLKSEFLDTGCDGEDCIPDEGENQSQGASQEELETWIGGFLPLTPDIEISQEELQEYLEGLVVPPDYQNGFLEVAVPVTALRAYILQKINNLGAEESILWEESPNIKYIGPYCPLTIYETGTAQSTINFAVSYMSEVDKYKYLNAIYPGVLIKANWSNMYGGKIEEKCVPCSNGSWNQNPCRLCPSGKVLRSGGCEERNPVIPVPEKEYCGDKIVQENEQCDDGNTNDGDGCDKMCKYEATISGPKSYTSIKEASGPVLYQIDLHSDDTDLTITSVEVTSAKPKNSPQINASHSTNMTWETKEIINNGKSAIITSEDYKWYGTKDLFLAWDSSSQSAYDVEIKATLSNGTVKTYTFILIVKFEDYSVVAEAKIDKLEGKYIKNGSVWNIGIVPEWFPKIYRSCVKGDELEFHVTAHAYNEMKGQYKNFVQEEEDFHVKQMEGEVDWSEGGWKGVEETLGNRLKNAQWCGSGTTETEAQDEALQEFHYTLEFIHNLLNNLIEQDTTRCFMEEKAKDKAKLTLEIGGLHLEGAYPFCHRGEQPEKSPIEIINDAFDDAGV